MSQLVRKPGSDCRVSDDTAPLGPNWLRALLKGSIVAVWCCSQSSDWYRTITTEPTLLTEKEERERSSVADDSSQDIEASGGHDTCAH